MNRSFALIFAGVLLVSVSTVSAEIYKWVDDQGVTHYGDKPTGRAGGAPSNARQMHLHGVAIFDQVKALTPIPYRGGENAPLIILNEILVKLKNSDREDVEIGTRTYSTYNSCIRPRPILWSEGIVSATDSSLISSVVTPFTDADYKMTSGSFMSMSNTSGRYSLDATITRLKLDICQSSASSGSQKASAYVKINWVLTDLLTRKEVYSVSTDGAENGFNHFKSKGALKALSRAVGMSTRNLLADKLFVQHVMSTESVHGKAKSFAELKVGLRYGNGRSTFKSQINNLKMAAVTVRTTSGHGSGVVIDKAGYILTNAHVVGDSTQVIIIANNLEIPGQVIRREPHRDVALVKTQPLSTVEPANITRSKLTEGDTIYVIGTPLDESLSHTITKGVYSAFREHDGLTFYQTDAAVNPGNSGGPVFDEHGELLAIAVAGIFTRSGASVNVNYLIPIKDALAALHLTKTRDFSYLMEDTEGSADLSQVKSTESTGNDSNTSIPAQSASDLYITALEQKRKQQFSAARDSLEQAIALTKPSQKEYAMFQDELHIKLPLAEARYYLQSQDSVRVSSTLEPIIGYLKTHPKRLEYMQQVEALLDSVGYLKQAQQASTNNTISIIKRMLEQYRNMHDKYPMNRLALVAYLKNNASLSDKIDVRFYRSDGKQYRITLYDKQSNKEYNLRGG